MDVLKKMRKGITEQTHREDPEEIKKEGFMYKPRIEASGESHPAHAWVLDFQFRICKEINFYGSSHPVQGTLLWQPFQTKYR